MAGECPLCYHERQSFYMHPRKKLWICHHCGQKGSLVRLVAKLEGIAYDEAVRRVLENDSIFVQRLEQREEIERAEIVLPKEYEPLAGATRRASKRYWKYAKSRGVTEELAERYRIGFCTSGEYAWRLLVPVYWLGELKTFVARDITNTSKFKVRTATASQPSETLFNLEQVWGREHVVVMEGVFDVLSMPDEAVATFGKKMSEVQAAILKEAGVRSLTICWDADAQPEAHEAARRLMLYFQVDVVKLPGDHDPSSAPPAVLREALSSSGGPSLRDTLRLK